MTPEEVQKWIDEQNMTAQEHLFATWVMKHTSVWQWRVRKEAIAYLINCRKLVEESRRLRAEGQNEKTR